MIAYLVHTGVISNSRIGWMGIASSDGTGYHSNAGVKTSCTSLSLQVSLNKVWMVLFGPLMFCIGTSGDYGVGLIVHAGKVADDEEVGVTEKR